MLARCLSEIKTSIWYWTIENNCCQVRPHCQTLVWGCSHQHRRTQLLIKHKVQNTHTLSVAPAAVAPAERVRMILFENLRKQLLWNYSAKNKQTLCVCGTWHTAAETALIVISKSTWTITAYLLFKVFNISQKRLMSKYSVKTEKQQQLWFSDLEHTTPFDTFCQRRSGRRRRWRGRRWRRKKRRRWRRKREKGEEEKKIRKKKGV